MLPPTSVPTYNHYNTTTIPPGYNYWFARLRGEPGPRNIANENGVKREYFIHETDMYSKKAQQFIERRSKKTAPFFLQVGTWAPHSPGAPATRHKDALSTARPLQKPSINEYDVKDKLHYVRSKARLTPEEMKAIRLDYRERVRSLLAVDEMVRDLVIKLENTGELDNTYIFFWSDNGYLHGEHRLTKKRLPYEESIRFPLIVRGPGVPAGQTRPALLGNHDFAPTFADIGGASVPTFVDGTSFAPLLDGTGPSRKVVLSESADSPIDAKPAWKLARTRHYTYVEYETGERELYDLREDPHQLVNLAGKRPEVEAELAERLAALKKCEGNACQTAESY